MLENFLKTHPPRLKCKSDPLITQNWKQYVKRKVLSLGLDLVQQQRLASFTVEGDTGKWWYRVWIQHEKKHGTQEELETTFDRQCISDMVYDLKRQELVNLKQGSTSVIEYGQHFVSLASFIIDLHLPDSMPTKMFEDRLSLHIRDRVSLYGLRKFRDMVEATLIAERNKTEAQKSYETHNQLRAQIEEQIRGKKPTSNQASRQRIGVTRDKGHVLRDREGMILIQQATQF